MSLNDLNVGEKGIIKQLKIESRLKSRLLDLGLVPGTKVECFMESPFGNPMAYLIKGAVIAIRNEDSKKIMVEMYNG
jgi:ferrous iron transport protein A